MPGPSFEFSYLVDGFGELMFVDKLFKVLVGVISQEEKYSAHKKFVVTVVALLKVSLCSLS